MQTATLEPLVYRINQSAMPHSYYIQFMQIYAEPKWYVVLRINDPTSCLTALPDGYDTVQEAYAAWLWYFAEKLGFDFPDDTAQPAGQDTRAVRDAEVYAELTYDAYCAAVGGTAFDGSPLPNWESFKADASKAKQAGAWLAIGGLMELAVTHAVLRTSGLLMHAQAESTRQDSNLRCTASQMPRVEPDSATGS